MKIIETDEDAKRIAAVQLLPGEALTVLAREDHRIKIIPFVKPNEARGFRVVLSNVVPETPLDDYEAVLKKDTGNPVEVVKIVEKALPRPAGGLDAAMESLKAEASRLLEAGRVDLARQALELLEGVEVFKNRIFSPGLTR